MNADITTIRRKMYLDFQATSFSLHADFVSVLINLLQLRMKVHPCSISYNMQSLSLLSVRNLAFTSVHKTFT